MRALAFAAFAFATRAFADEPVPEPVPPVLPPPSPVDFDDDDEDTPEEPAPVDVPDPRPALLPAEVNLDEPPVARRDPFSGAAATVKVGVGTGDFTQANPRDITGIGPSWDVRGVFGAHSPIGIEAAYVGSARGVGAPSRSIRGVDDTAALLANGVEGDVRLAAPLRAGEFLDVRPFAFGGIGWQYLNLVGEGDRDNDEGDHIVTIPAGIGLEVGIGPLNFDLRGTYRHAVDSEIFGAASAEFDDPSALHSYNVGAGLGFEF